MPSDVYLAIIILYLIIEHSLYSICFQRSPGTIDHLKIYFHGLSLCDFVYTNSRSQCGRKKASGGFTLVK